ncbi:hypothetical protein GGH91_000128 [Coemansia sp. RSA 2671]|nr:hypothetical protein GGH91_000128 [Coemansia sp. RSA 2671]
MTRKRASSSATLEIVGAAPQPKQRQSQPEPAITANGGGGVSISGTAEGTASKLDMALPPSHAQEENTDGSSAKRLKISGERKKRSIFGYRMEALLTDSAAGNRRPAGSPEQKSQTEAVGLAIASTRTSAAASNGDGAGRLRIARSAADVPETVRNPGLR